MKNRYLPSIVLILLIASGKTAAAVTALSLANQAPADAVAYFGWAGSDALATEYSNSPLRGLIARSNLPRVAGDMLPKILDRLAAVSSDQPLFDILHRSFPILWRHPTAVFITAALDPTGPPIIHVGVLCDAGNDADILLRNFNTIVTDRAGLHLKANRTGSIIRLTDIDIPTEPALDRSAAFVSAMKPLQESPAVAMFVNGAAILQLADQAAARNESSHDIWPKVRDALGIATIKGFAMTGGFDQGNWATASALIAPSPRTGILAAFEPRPIDPALLARIPGGAESVAVYNFDAAKLFDAIADAMASSTASDTMLHRATGAASLVLGANLRQALLGPLGPQWIIYTDSKRTAILNHPSDAATASDSMVSAAFGIINTANARIPNAAITAVQQKIDRVDLTSANSPQLERFVGTPTFALQDRILYFAASPEASVAAVTLPAVPEQNDFLHNATFAEALYRLHVPSPASIDYTNLPLTAPRAYERLKGEQSALAAIAKMAGLELPELQLPPIEKLNLSPAISVSWADNNGVYTKSLSPFPGSAALLGDPQESVISVAAVATVAAVVVPAIAKAREQANLVANMGNERQLLLAMISWSMQHQGTLPPDLGTLVGMPQIEDLSLFLRHGSGTHVPPEITNSSAAEQAKWVNEHAEFTYLNAGKTFASLNSPSTTAVLVEKDPRGPRSAVGFADGHVEARLTKMSDKP
jgi:prepilin-type processing-associated H-X9-DG protein